MSIFDRPLTLGQFLTLWGVYQFITSDLLAGYLAGLLL